MSNTRNPKQPTPLTLQNRFKFDREDYLDQCRNIAKKLLRNGGSITIEDITKICPRPTYLHHNILGSVFDNQFRAVGYTTAKHRAAKGHVIRQWVLKLN